MPVSLTTRPSTRERSMKCLERLPKLSPMMVQLLARLAKRNCDVSELTSVVEKDPLLSAQVLRLSNSAIFGRIHPIGSVKHAIAMVGVGTMRKFALGSSISNLFSKFKTAPSFSVTRFNLHSVGVATLVELLSDEVPIEYARGAFMAGLLHDVGRLLIAVNMQQQFEDILGLAAVNGLPLLDCEREVLGTDHAELSGMAIARWDLAEQIQWAATYHHAPENALDVERAGPGKLGLSVVVNRADAFINYLGMSTLPASIIVPEPPKLEFDGCQLSQDRVLNRFEQEWKTINELFR